MGKITSNELSSKFLNDLTNNVIYETAGGSATAIILSSISLDNGAAKTFIASECIRLTHALINRERVLFVVDGIDLFHQSVAEISNFLGILCRILQ